MFGPVTYMKELTVGLLVFLRQVGEKLLGKGDEQAASDPARADQTAADAIRNYIGAQGIDTSSLTVAFDGVSRTVTLSGSLPDPDTVAKAIVAAGNVQGVAAVNTDGLPEAPGYQYHDVVSGDNLSKIAQKYYGNASLYDLVFQANRPMLSSPDKIYPGQKLVIPPQQ